MRWRTVGRGELDGSPCGTSPPAAAEGARRGRRGAATGRRDRQSAPRRPELIKGSRSASTNPGGLDLVASRSTREDLRVDRSLAGASRPGSSPATTRRWGGRPGACAAAGRAVTVPDWGQRVSPPSRSLRRHGRPAVSGDTRVRRRQRFTADRLRAVAARSVPHRPSSVRSLVDQFARTAEALVKLLGGPGAAGAGNPLDTAASAIALSSRRRFSGPRSRRLPVAPKGTSRAGWTKPAVRRQGSCAGRRQAGASRTTARTRRSAPAGAEMFS